MPSSEQSVERNSTEPAAQPSSASAAVVGDSEDGGSSNTPVKGSRSLDQTQNESSANSKGSENSGLPIPSAPYLDRPARANADASQPAIQSELESAATVERSEVTESPEGKKRDRKSTSNEGSSRRAPQENVPSKDALAQKKLDKKLRAAARDGKVDIARELLDKGANAFSKSSSGYNALHIAILHSHSSLVQLLLERNSKLCGETDRSNHTPLQIAILVDGDSTDVISIILEKAEKKDVVYMALEEKTTALHDALRKGKVKRATAILKSKHGRKTAGTYDFEQNTALHLACQFGHTEVVRLLLDMGLRITTQNMVERTPLHLAFSNGKDELMQLLLRDEELKDAVRIKDLRGRTALFKCIKNDEGVKWMQSLIDAGADVAIEDEGGWTPLIYACVNGSMEMVRLLVRNGADINHIPEDGWTALHTVVQNGLVEQTKFLLQEGAHVNLPTGDDHETPLHIAARTDHVEIVRELLNMHANTEWTTKNGNETALHIASRLGHVDIVRELLKEGADPTKEISKNRTALELATKYNSDEYRMIRVELLKKLKDGARDVGIAQLASSTNWNTLEPLLDGLHEQEHSDLKEQLTLTCLASDPDVFSHEKLCSMLAGKTDSRPDKHEKWTALHWAAYLGYSDLVLWQLRSRPPKGMKGTLKSVTSMVQNIMDRKMPAPTKKGSAETVSTDIHYQITLDWLRNPPLIPVKTENKRSFNISTNDRKMCAEMFDATITDFYKEGWKEGKDGKVEFLSRVRTVEKVIYEEPTIPKPGHLKYHSREAWRTEVWQKSEARYNLTFGLKEEDKSSARRQGPAKNAEPAAAGPMQIMENALKQLKELNTKMDSLSAAANKVQYTKDDLCFRWIHLPANNLEWMIDATERVYHDNGKTDENKGVPEMLQASWRELRGSKSEVRHLRPTCVKELVQRSSGQDSAEKPKPKPTGADAEGDKSTDADAEGDKPKGDEEHNNTKAEQNKKSTGSTGDEPAQTSPQTNLPKTYHRLALYMPYVTFSTYSEHTKKTEKTEETEQTEAAMRDTALLDTYRKARDRLGPKNRANSIKKDGNTGSDEASKVLSTDTVDEVKILVTDKEDLQEDPSGGNNQHVDAIVHRTRTLDEFYYDTLHDTTDRDKDQVVWRHLRPLKKWKEEWKEGDPIHILRVDQLWVWVIDEETILTSSTNRIDDEDDPVVEGIHDYFREAKGKGKKQVPAPTTVDEMVKFITTFCIEFMDRSTVKCGDAELSARQIFAKTINRAADKEKKLFEEFQDKIRRKLKKFEDERASAKETPTESGKPGAINVLRRFLAFVPSVNEESSGHQKKGRTDAKGNSVDESERTDQELEYLSIRAATDLLLEVKDIRDELNILRYLLTQQQSVWERLHDVHDSSKYEHSQQDNKADDMNFRKQAEKWKSPMELIKDVTEMDKATLMIQEAVNSILELEQNDASISEAEQARQLSIVTIEQGKTLMAFAIVTIVFLPLSFLTSLFAVNISAFPHKGDELFYTPGYIFPMIFGIAAATVLVVVAWVFKDNIVRKISQWQRRKTLKPGTVEKAEKTSDVFPIETTKEWPSDGKSAARFPVPGIGRRRVRQTDEEKDLGGSSRKDSGASREKVIAAKLRNTDSDE